MKTKFRKAIDCIIDKDDTEAKKIIKEAIQTDARYISYKELLRTYDFDFKTIVVAEKTYDDLQEILKKYPVDVRLAVLDETYKLIKNEND